MNSSSTEPAAVRRFGLVAALLFGGLAGFGLWRGKPVPAALFGVLFMAGMFCLALPGPAAPVYRAWMAVAHRIGTGVTTVLLTVAFYGVITPAALVKRVFGGRPLPLRPDPNLPTYWRERSDPFQPRDRFTKRF